MASSRKIRKPERPDGEGLPRGEAAYRYIRSAIQDGHLTPGERLREIDLAKQIVTVSGAGKYLKEKNPAIRVIAGDPVGSLYTGYHKSRVMGEGAPVVSGKVIGSFSAERTAR